MNIQFPSALLTSNSSPTTKSQATEPESSFQEALEQASANPHKLADAAKQFEALMIGQVLKAAHDSSGGGWFGSGDDSGSEMTMELAEQQLAQALSSRGGLGIAKLVMKNLDHGGAKAASSGSPSLAGANGPSKDSPR